MPLPETDAPVPAAPCASALPQNVEIYLVKSSPLCKDAALERRKQALVQKTLGTALVHWVFARHGMADITIAHTEEGKPFVPGSALFFNISHSKQLVCAAFSSYPVGIDIEYLRPLAPGVMARFFSRAGIVPEAGNDERLRTFFTLWTRNEAFLKAVGSGWRGAQPIHGQAPYQNAQWHIQSFCPDTEYAGALCTPGLLDYTFTEVSCHDVLGNDVRG